jgi:hypothetical protein
MNYYKVKSIEHLREFIDKDENEFVVRLGMFNSSKYITYSAKVDGIFVLHYIDDEEEDITWDELLSQSSYFARQIQEGRLYCETNHTYDC